MSRKTAASLIALLLSLAGLSFGAVPSLASVSPHVSPVVTTVPVTQPGGGRAVPLVGAPGTYKPDASNTGYVGTLSGSIGTPGSPLVIKADNTAKNVTIKNSSLHCGSYVPSSNSGCVDANSSVVFGLKLFDNLDPQEPTRVSRASPSGVIL
jgi:hypothetical protein